MLAWMLYVVVVTILLSGAALAAERSAQIRRAPTRWLWGASIIASLLVPTVIASVSIQIPSLSSVLDHAVPNRLIPLRQMTSAALAPSVWLTAAAGRVSAAPGLDVMLERGWIVASAALFLAILFSGAQLHRRKRHWDRRTIAGVPVYVSEDVGPAVVGLLHPQIVVPRWIAGAAPETQKLVLAHEQSHLDANDARLLAIAVLLIVTMPWNLPLWWQLWRLRFAIEVDCDARVLKGGHDVSRYGQTLIMVGERQSTSIAVVAAMSESKSHLEQRLHKMLWKQRKFAWASATALACLGVVLAASAAEVSPPNADRDGKSEMHEISLAPAALEGDVGFYKLGENAVLTVTRNGAQLSAQLTGQPAAPIYARSRTEFFYKVVNAQLTFIPDAAGRATSVTLHQNGQTLSLPRIDAAAAQQISDRLTARVKAQTQSPGTEAALRRLIDGVMTGKPDYDAMTPALAAVVRKQMPAMQPGMASLGPVRSIKFLGVSSQGLDSYNVMHERGALHWMIGLDAQGKIAGALVTPGP